MPRVRVYAVRLGEKGANVCDPFLSLHKFRICNNLRHDSRSDGTGRRPFIQVHNLHANFMRDSSIYESE